MAQRRNQLHPSFIKRILDAQKLEADRGEQCPRIRRGVTRRQIREAQGEILQLNRPGPERHAHDARHGLRLVRHNPSCGNMCHRDVARGQCDLSQDGEFGVAKLALHKSHELNREAALLVGIDSGIFDEVDEVPSAVVVQRLALFQ